MKYCKKCGVNVHHQQTNCPLCGGYLDEINNNDNCAVYANQDEIVAYPILKENAKQPFFKYKFNKILIVLAVISVALNLLLTPDLHWAYYVACSVVCAIFAVMTPINNKQKLTKILREELFWATVFAVALELGICNWSYAWFTAEYVLPWLYASAIVTLDFLLIFRRHNNRQLFSSLIIASLYAVTPQILFWISPLWNVHCKTLITFVVFFAAICNVLVFGIVCSRTFKEEMERNLSI